MNIFTLLLFFCHLRSKYSPENHTQTHSAEEEDLIKHIPLTTSEVYTNILAADDKDVHFDTLQLHTIVNLILFQQ
jgi:hypothetical protein